mgnify:CR=1 FL=1
MNEFYKIPYGMANLKAHPNNVPLIVHNASLDSIMEFGDKWRGLGRTPCVILPSPTLGGALGSAWQNHDDMSGLLDNVPAHIEALIVDYASAEKPVTPDVWKHNKPSPEWVLWEYEPEKVCFNGLHKNHFIEMFGYDPEGWQPPTGGGGGTTPDPVVVEGKRKYTFKFLGFTITGISEPVIEEE